MKIRTVRRHKLKEMMNNGHVIPQKEKNNTKEQNYNIKIK